MNWKFGKSSPACSVRQVQVTVVQNTPKNHTRKRQLLNNSPCLQLLPSLMMMDAESYWDDLPKGTKELLLGYPKEINNNEDNGLAIGFVSLCSIQFFHIGNREYDWNLWRSLTSSCVIAADFLIKEKDEEAVFIIFFVAFLRECLARGCGSVERWLGKCRQRLPSSSDSDAFGLVIPTEMKCDTYRVKWKLLFSKFTFFQLAVANTQSRKAMADFLSNVLAKHTHLKHWANRLDDVRSQDASNTPIHSFDGSKVGIVPEELMTITVAGVKVIEEVISQIPMDDDAAMLSQLSSGETASQRTVVVGVYKDTTLKWLFDYFIALVYDNYKLLSGRAKLIQQQLLRYPCCVSLRKKQHFYLATSGKKTLHELGIEDGDVLHLGQVLSGGGDVVQLGFQLQWEGKPTPIKKEQSKKQKARNKSKRSKKKHSPQVPPSKQELDLDALREIHSNDMEPVFDELRPQLKAIRDKLNALSLKKDCPKERSANKISKGKENVLALTGSTMSMENLNGGKAGKAVYPILVGEASNLFKTPQLRMRKRSSQVITLDLHGCSRYKALGMMRRGLREWVDEAMKGEYPFVISVNVICGGGNQVLSELVAQFIRDNPQVANRPKGIVYGV